MTKKTTTYARRVRESSEWLVRAESDDFSPEDQAAFDVWRADQGNARSYERSRMVWDDIAALGELSERNSQRAQGVLDTKTGFRAAVGGVLTETVSGWAAPVGAMCALVLLTVWTIAPWNMQHTHYATDIAEIRDYTLADGSHVTMAAKSSMTVSMTEEERRVQLSAGDAFFSVVKDPARPFIVIAGNTRVQVVGTRFNVHHGPEEVRVAVEEGIVNVAREEAANDNEAPGVGADAVPGAQERDNAVAVFEPLVLTAGQKVVASHAGTLDIVETVRPEEAGAWRSGRLNYNNVGLAEIVADANRYLESEIILSDESLRMLRLTTSFRTDEVQEFIATLDLVLPVEVRQETGADGRAKTVVRSKS